MKLDRGWWPGVKAIPSPNADPRPDPSDISLLVIHNISLPPGEFGRGDVVDFFLNRLPTRRDPYYQLIKDLKVSAHLFIDRWGELIQFVSFTDRAWHAGLSSFAGRDHCNDYAIGIELEGTDVLPYTHEQYQTLAKVTLVLMSAYAAITPQRIVGHCDIAPGRKTDPGLSFDWHLYFSLLHKGSK